MSEIEIKENILDENDRIALETAKGLKERKIFAVNVMGAPGVGKTSNIKAICEKLDVTPYVLEGDIESDIDTEALNELGIKSFQINTHGSCHLDAPTVSNAIDEFDVNNGILFIENIGNLVCPAEFFIGENIKMMIVSVTDGSDKPYKYPLMFEKSDIIILNKVDLIPYVDFDEEFFMRGVRALNKNVPVFKVDARSKSGFESVALWLREKIN